MDLYSMNDVVECDHRYSVEVPSLTTLAQNVAFKGNLSEEVTEKLIEQLTSNKKTSFSSNESAVVFGIDKSLNGCGAVELYDEVKRLATDTRVLVYIDSGVKPHIVKSFRNLLREFSVPIYSEIDTLGRELCN